MSISIVVSGNEVVGNIFRNNLNKHLTSCEFELSVYEPQCIHKKGEPELYTTAMRNRTAEKAQEACMQIPNATVGVCFESGVIQTALVVDLVDLNIIDMSPEEIFSGKILEEIRKRSAMAMKDSPPSFINTSVVSVVDAEGLIVQSDTLDVDGKTHVSFTWGEPLVTEFVPEAVDNSGRVPHQLPFLRALQETLVAYHDILASVPTRKN